MLWTPSKQLAESSNIRSYTRWLASKGHDVGSYNQLWRWSVDNIDEFWESVWNYFSIIHGGSYTDVLSTYSMPGVKWFDGTYLNYAEHALRNDTSNQAIIFEREDGVKLSLSYQELRKKIASLAETLKEIGVEKGDRVAALLPNSPEAIISLLATSSIGAVWSSCSVDFGLTGAFDRFMQIQPKVLIGVDGYLYNGKRHDRTDLLRKLKSAIPSIKKVIMIPYTSDLKDDWLDWGEATGKNSSLSFERVPFNHPLWILYSSGTTGLPKPIVHSHGGILLEHLKTLAFHNDLKIDDRFFWFTSTGWMMWNYLAGGLLTSSTILLYDGSPSYPSMSRLWDFAEKNEMTYFGTSAAYISALSKSRVEPIQTHNLKLLRGIGSTGSPLSADLFRWVYKNVKKDVWLASISGGTDVCTAFVGGCPILPVVAGRIQCIYLGAAVDCFDEDGKSVRNMVGELVLTKPMPSMPVMLWNDPDFSRYKQSYFETFPGVWRHGDWIKIMEDGSCIIYGRSDATIKRRGVRIGTAEIYAAVEKMDEVLDSLAVDVGDENAGKMILFVTLKEGLRLDELLTKKIKDFISKELTPRYVPDEVVQVPEVPRTLNGKKMEVPVKRILMGFDPNKVVNPGSMANPDSLKFFIELAKRIRKKEG